MEINMASRKSPISDSSLIPRVKQVSVASIRDFSAFLG